MHYPGKLTAAGMAEPLAEARLAVFDRIRELLITTGLPPVPDVYDLLWRHVGGDDFHLSAAVNAAIMAGRLDLAMVATLRTAHCGVTAAGDISALVAAAHEQAVRMTGRLAGARSDLAEYGQTIADGDAALNGKDMPHTPDALAALIERLGAATGAMLVANGRMEAELALAAAEAGGLRDRLARAERAAITDPLTGLLNRRGVMEFIAGARGRAEPGGGMLPLSIAMIDIDHFKQINDRWGHAIGDEVLCYVAAHLADGIAAVAASGAAGRMGGEEFIAVLPGMARGAAVAAIDRLRSTLAAQLIRRDSDGANLGRVSFSAGVAADRAEDSIGAVIARADAVLYTAKHLGRDRVIPERS